MSVSQYPETIAKGVEKAEREGDKQYVNSNCIKHPSVWVVWPSICKLFERFVVEIQRASLLTSWKKGVET
jgi:hypothetical protein